MILAPTIINFLVYVQPDNNEWAGASQKKSPLMYIQFTGLHNTLIPTQKYSNLKRHPEYNHFSDIDVNLLSSVNLLKYTEISQCVSY